MRSILKKYSLTTMTFSDFIDKIKLCAWGKYVITLLVFLVIYLFVGDQSMLRFWHRGREIRHLEQQRDMYQAGIEETEAEIEMLTNPDSLERFAREQYFMHEQNEDIYLVEEKE